MIDPYVVYTDDGDKQIKKDKYVYMVYKYAANILKDLKFKHKTVNDYNQHLCGGWSFYKHTEFEEVDRVAKGLKPAGISTTRDLSLAEAKRKELSNKGFLATIYKRRDLYFVTASPRGTLGKFFRNLNVLIEDYRRNGLVYCADMMEYYRNVNFIKFHNLEYDDHHTCITGLVLGYPIENTMALIIRDDNDGEDFDFEEYNKEAIEEDHMNDDDCDCEECCERRYNSDNKEKTCICEDCHIYRYNSHVVECEKQEDCEDCKFYKKYFEELQSSDEEDNTGELNVIPYDEEAGLFRDFNNFIVFQLEPGKIGVIGKYIEDKDSVIPLSAEDLIQARKIGLITHEDLDETVDKGSWTDIWELD